MYDKLESERIYLRKYLIDDYISINEWWNDNSCTKWMGNRFSKYRTLDESKQSLKQIIENSDKESVYFAIADKNTNEYLGGIDLTSIDHHDRRGILSIVIGNKTKRNIGIGNEAITLFLNFCFNSIGLNKIELRVSEGNIQAIQCYKKCGFKEVGTLRKHNLIDNKYYDLILMDILKEEIVLKTI